MRMPLRALVLGCNFNQRGELQNDASGGVVPPARKSMPPLPGQWQYRGVSDQHFRDECRLARDQSWSLTPR